MLSIPVLVYLFRIEASVATGYSLFLIGVTAFSGAIQNIRKQLVDFRVALFYGVPSVVTIYIMRRFVVHSLPDTIIDTGTYTLNKNDIILILFSVVMLAAAYKMITEKPKVVTEEKPHETNRFLLTLYAVGIGFFLGIVGAGGGFLIIPALVYFANLPMKKAIGTSLVLVSVNSFLGFAGDLGANPHMDWRFLFAFSGFSIAGVFVGSHLSNRIDGPKLKKLFGWFILIMGIYIAIRELTG